MKAKLPVLMAVTVLILAAGSVLLWTGEAESSANDYTVIVDQFFTMVEKGEYGPAVDFLYAGNSWVPPESAEVTQLRGQFVSLPGIVGSYLGNELMRQEKLGERYVYLWYFVATERQPLAFKFQFYKPADTWMIYSFAYDGDLIESWLAARGEKQFTTKE